MTSWVGPLNFQNDTTGSHHCPLEDIRTQLLLFQTMVFIQYKINGGTWCNQVKLCKENCLNATYDLLGRAERVRILLPRSKSAKICNDIHLQQPRRNSAKCWRCKLQKQKNGVPLHSAKYPNITIKIGDKILQQLRFEELAVLQHPTKILKRLAWCRVDVVTFKALLYLLLSRISDIYIYIK